MVHDLASANLSLQKDRIQNVRRLINLAGPLKQLSDLVKITGIEYIPMQRFTGYVLVTGYNS